jgi:hypothetical protein
LVILSYLCSRRIHRPDTASSAACVPALIPRRPSGGPPFGASGPASSRPSRLCSCSCSYIYVQYEKRHMAVGRKEVEIPGTCPIARCDRGFKSCCSQKFGSPTGTFNGPGQAQFPVSNFALFVPAAHQ